MQRLAILLFAIVGYGAQAFGATEVQVPLGSRNYVVFELTTSQPTRSIPVEVPVGGRLAIDVRTPGSAVDVSITDPSGADVDPLDILEFDVLPDEAPPLGGIFFDEGIHIQFVDDTPLSGTWSVHLSLPAGVDTTRGTVSSIVTGGIEASVLTSRPVYQSGDIVVVGMVAFEGPFPATGATAMATVIDAGSLGDDVSIDVFLFDDGVEPDDLIDDGLYTGQIDDLEAGHYLVEGTLVLGANEIVAGTDFEVIDLLGRFAGTFTDAAVDDNGDGLIDRIELTLDVDIETPGVYGVIAELGSGDRFLRSGSTADLPFGPQEVIVSFDAEEIRDGLAADGPYDISEAILRKIAEDPGQPSRVADKVVDLGTTEAYQLSNLQRPITLIQPGLTDSVMDDDGNGLHDRLSVEFNVDTLQAGGYTWSADLRSPQGTVLAVAGNGGQLVAGINALTLDFDGSKIGRSGEDGPYVVHNVAVYGPPDAAAVLDVLGDTAFYLASEFEGGVVSFDRLEREVEDLVITGIGGIPVAHGIRTSLLQKITGTRRLLEAGQARAAKRVLGAFVAEVEAQRGKHLFEDDADLIVDLATQLAASL